MTAARRTKSGPKETKASRESKTVKKSATKKPNLKMVPKAPAAEKAEKEKSQSNDHPFARFMHHGGNGKVNRPAQQFYHQPVRKKAV